MPPGIIGELLRPAIDLPPAADVERFVVHKENAARRLPFCICERADVDALGAAMDRMRTRITGPLGTSLGSMTFTICGFLGSGPVSRMWMRDDRKPGTMR